MVQADGVVDQVSDAGGEGGVLSGAAEQQRRRVGNANDPRRQRWQRGKYQLEAVGRAASREMGA